MKKYFVILILPLIFITSCRQNSLRLYEHGKFKESINLVNSLEHPSSEDYLAKALSLKEIDELEKAKDSILMYLLSSANQGPSKEREFAVEEFLKEDFSDELSILCLVPDDGKQAQIRLYQAYSNIEDIKNSRFLVDSYLSNTLPINELTALLVNYPSDPVYTVGIFENWLKTVQNNQKQEFSELLYKFINSKYINEQCARTVIHICQTNENDKFYTSSNQALAFVYKTHSKALEITGDEKSANTYMDKAYKISK